MAPTLSDGETVTADPYGRTSPERGDVIVFRAPTSITRDFIKRIIGVPGDAIHINETNGEVSVNGGTLEEPYIQGTTNCNNTICSWPVPALTTSDAASSANTPRPHLTSPEEEQACGRTGCYFVMGDNRQNSSDSRQGWLVPRENIYGKVTQTSVRITLKESATPSLAAGPTLPADGYKHYVSPNQGFEIDVPSDWLPIPDFPLEFEGQEFVADLFQGAPEAGFSVNVNILHSPAGQLTAAQLYAVEVARSRDAHSDLVVESISLHGHPAKLLNYTTRPLPENPLLDQSQVIYVLDGTEWILTLSTVSGTRQKYLSMFRQMWESFEPR